MSTLTLFLPVKNHGPQGPSWGSGLAALWAGGSQSAVPPLTLLMLSFLVSIDQRGASTSPLCLGVFRVVSYLRMVGLLVRGAEVENKLCHRLNDITIEGVVLTAISL